MLTTTITLTNGNTIQAEIAATEKSRRIGLSRRAGLAPGHGMLLAFEHEAPWGITMQAMSFNLDLLWLSRDKRVFDMWKGAGAGDREMFLPRNAALYILEVPTCTIHREGIRLGDVLRF